MAAPVDELRRRKAARAEADEPVFSRIAGLTGKELQDLGDFEQMSDFLALSYDINIVNSRLREWNELRKVDQASDTDRQKLARLLTEAYTWVSIVAVKVDLVLDHIPLMRVSDGTLDENEKVSFQEKKCEVEFFQRNIRTRLGICESQFI